MRIILLAVAHLFALSGFGQKMNYEVDLVNCNKDQIAVTLKTNFKGSSSADYHFPMTVPGTYAVLDYGRFITKFKAYNSEGKTLKVKKSGNNTFIITPGTDVAKIEYLVDDSWEEKNDKTKIFEPAGTGFEKDKYFYINSGAFIFTSNLVLYKQKITISMEKQRSWWG